MWRPATSWPTICGGFADPGNIKRARVCMRTYARAREDVIINIINMMFMMMMTSAQHDDHVLLNMINMLMFMMMLIKISSCR